jgi:hypothetical protein
MAARATDAGMAHVATGFTDSARGWQQQAHTIRQLLFGRTLPEPPPSAAPPRTTRARAKKAKNKTRRSR